MGNEGALVWGVRVKGRAGRRWRGPRSDRSRENKMLGETHTHTHTHARTHAHTHARTHARTHTRKQVNAFTVIIRVPIKLTCSCSFYILTSSF